MANFPAPSNLALALAGTTKSVDIPKPRDGGPAIMRDTKVSHSITFPVNHHGLLPTPPNSVSPTLRPHDFKRLPGINLPCSPPAAPLTGSLDTDSTYPVDRSKCHSQLQPTPLVAEALSTLNGTGAISPAMLAKHYLPELLLRDGPLAIRHIICYLTTSVPGFSRIPQAKARRLVVAALEGRGTSSGDGDTTDANVMFEKVGWGRWDARRRDHQRRDGATSQLSPPNSVPVLRGRACMPASRTRTSRSKTVPYGSSMTGDSAIFSHSEFEYGDHEDAGLSEHEVDKMSLEGDGNGYTSCSEAPDDDAIMEENWDEADLTDEEDWAQIGAAALRARSFLGSSADKEHIYNLFPGRHKRTSHGYGGGPAYSSLAKPVGGIPIQHHDFAFPDGVDGGTEERAAVEALLRLGKM